jgi:DNA-binding NarL/FixJ family response regulator
MLPQAAFKTAESRQLDVLIVARNGGGLHDLAALRPPDWRCAVVHDALSAERVRQAAHPPAVVADLELGGGSADGLELCLRLRHESEDLCLILVLSAVSSPRDKLHALSLGVDDCVSLPMAAADLRELIEARVDAIQRRSATQPIDSAGRSELIERRVEEWGRAFRLSARERQILTLVARGAHPKQVAAQLGCGYASVRTHLRRLAQKLGCSGTREVLVRFFGGDGRG